MNEATSFQSLLADETLPIIEDYSSESTTVLIAFGGIKGALGIPVFEFYKLTSDFESKKIYVRDVRQAWYHFGLPGVADTVEGIASRLKRAIEGQEPDRVVALGNSMGGYAALLFGCLLQVNEVHAFSPQTFIGRFHRLIYRDRRWQPQIRKIHRAARSAPRFYDLKRVLESDSGGDTAYHIHFSTGDRLDRAHAVRMRKIPRVALHSYDEGGHNLVRHLREARLLRGVLLNSLKEP